MDSAWTWSQDSVCHRCLLWHWLVTGYVSSKESDWRPCSDDHPARGVHGSITQVSVLDSHLSDIALSLLSERRKDGCHSWKKLEDGTKLLKTSLSPTIELVL